MNHENLPRHIAERIVADFGANTEFALQELEKYRTEAAGVGQEWQDYFAYVMSLPAPEGSSETAMYQRQTVTVVEVQPTHAAVEAPPEPAPGGLAGLWAVEPAAPAAAAEATVTPAATTQFFERAATTEAAVVVADSTPAPAPAALAPRSRALAPLILPGDVVEPVRGGMVRFV
ncbi:MAG: hypothetical protein K1Y01_22435, partial [Vicinamibacteria bacterium]|nr:hypothetical protein [Vicinamibacteria bacterium]